MRPESKAKGRDRFLLADFPLLIVVSERKITSEWPFESKTTTRRFSLLLLPALGRHRNSSTPDLLRRRGCETGAVPSLRAGVDDLRTRPGRGS